MSTKIGRVRAPHKVHILSWSLALEKTGSVPCSFKNCKFLAISLEEMAYHYTHCRCEMDQLGFKCDTCGQCTDNSNKLVYHMIHGHSYQATLEELSNLNSFLSEMLRREVPPILKKTWDIFFENRKYYKCLQKFCSYIPDTFEELEEHYIHHCKPRFWRDLIHVCDKCSGRFYNETKLRNHIRSAHNPMTQKTTITKSGLTLEDIQKSWVESIVRHKQAKCPVEECRFVCNSISSLEKHYRGCTGQQKLFVTCPICNCWLQNDEKLIEHQKCVHKESEVICKTEVFDDTYSTYENRSKVVDTTPEPTVEEEESKNVHDTWLKDTEGTCILNTEPTYIDDPSIFLKTEIIELEEPDPLIESHGSKNDDPVSSSEVTEVHETDPLAISKTCELTETNMLKRKIQDCGEDRVDTGELELKIFLREEFKLDKKRKQYSEELKTPKALESEEPIELRSENFCSRPKIDLLRLQLIKGCSKECSRTENNIENCGGDESETHETQVKRDHGTQEVSVPPRCDKASNSSTEEDKLDTGLISKEKPDNLCANKLQNSADCISLKSQRACAYLQSRVDCFIREQSPFLRNLLQSKKNTQPCTQHSENEYLKNSSCTCDINSVNNLLQNGVNSKDDCQIFGDLIASKLRNLKSEEKRNLLKQKIYQALLSMLNSDSDGE